MTDSILSMPKASVITPVSPCPTNSSVASSKGEMKRYSDASGSKSHPQTTTVAEVVTNNHTTANESRIMSPSPARTHIEQIKAALRMYPRNTWGPATKWGYLEKLQLQTYEKDHFGGNKVAHLPTQETNDVVEKERIAARKFGHVRHNINYDVIKPAPEAVAMYCPPSGQHMKNAEVLLHAENDKRIARGKEIDALHHSEKQRRERDRIEERNGQFTRNQAHEAHYRKNPGFRKNRPSVSYDLISLQYHDGYAGERLKYMELSAKWRAAMRALRIQSKQSGNRMYNVINWRPSRACTVLPPKPNAPQVPTKSDEGQLSHRGTRFPTSIQGDDGWVGHP